MSEEIILYPKKSWAGVHKSPPSPHSALLLTSSGQFEVTNYAISNNKNHSRLEYREIKESYQTY